MIVLCCISHSQAPHQFPPTLAQGVNSRSLLFTDPYAQKRIQLQNSKVSQYFTKIFPKSRSICPAYSALFGPTFVNFANLGSFLKPHEPFRGEWVPIHSSST